MLIRLAVGQPTGQFIHYWTIHIIVDNYFGQSTGRKCENVVNKSEFYTLTLILCRQNDKIKHKKRQSSCPDDF